jgi:hypothetical protein
MTMKPEDVKPFIAACLVVLAATASTVHFCILPVVTYIPTVVVDTAVAMWRIGAAVLFTAIIVEVRALRRG